MFNAKWGFICGGAAFALAFVVSLLWGHTSALVALTRGGVFAAVFFGLGTGVWALINIFVPELLETQHDAVGNVFSGEASGSRVNITLDDTPNAALPANFSPGMGIGLVDSEEVGDFNDLISQSADRGQDIDQNPATGYTEKAGMEEFAPIFDNAQDDVKIEGLGDFSMDFGAFIPEGGKAADVDPLMDDPFSFLPGTGDSMSAGEATTAEASAPPQRKSSSHKPAELKGDFNPKEIAAGIRTVLEKDKKG